MELAWVLYELCQNKATQLKHYPIPLPGSPQAKLYFKLNNINSNTEELQMLHGIAKPGIKAIAWK